MIEMASTNLARRSLRYVAIALAVFLAVFLLVVVSNGAKELPDWLTVGAFTCGLFWITIRESKEYWPRVGFWMAMFGILIVHVALLLAILRVYPAWRPIWFAPLILVEGAFLAPILFLLFGRPPRR